MYIIAVDDEFLSRMDIEWAIQNAVPDAELLCFDAPLAALDFVRENRVDVAYLDIKMPEMNGIELAERIRDICPETNIIFSTGYDGYALDAFTVQASGYLLKPITAEAIVESLKNLRIPVENNVKKLRVKCFGNFDVFIDDTPIHFPRQKAKELFAYLIHKRGTSCTTREICAAIYEDGERFSALDKQIQTQISTMMKVLKDAGVSDVIIKKRNSLAVDIKKVDCDYYSFLERDPDAISLYMGEYMSNYSWAEFKTDYLDIILDKG